MLQKYKNDSLYIFTEFTSKYKPIVCALKNYNLNSRDKLLLNNTSINNHL